MPRVLMIHTGGTLMMRPHGASATLAAPSRAAGESLSGPVGGASLAEGVGRHILAEVPSLARVADVETRILFSLDSGDMRPWHWVALAQEVHGALETGRYDGVVVVHGTDTMAYSASALALLLGPLPKPVVFTGSQRPLLDVRTDARENLVDATVAATLDLPEVCITFASRVMRGARTTKRDAWGFDAFDAPNCAPLVTLGLGLGLAPHRRASAALAPFDGRIEPRVLALRVFPGMEPALIEAALASGVRGLVLEAYGTGNLPRGEGSLIPALHDARARGVPVVVVSQCLRGFVELERYEGGAEAEAAGAVSGGDMTVEAALAKLMIGLARHADPAAVADYVRTNQVGERSA